MCFRCIRCSVNTLFPQSYTTNMNQSGSGNQRNGPSCFFYVTNSGDSVFCHAIAKFMFSKITTVVLISLALISLFLPYQEFESMWTDFDASGFLSSVDDSFTKNRVNTGYELIVPIIPVALLTIGNCLSGFSKIPSINTIGIILISISSVFTIHLFFALSTPADPQPYSLTRPPTPIIGIGYYLLLPVAVFSIILSVLKSSIRA